MCLKMLLQLYHRSGIRLQQAESCMQAKNSKTPSAGVLLLFTYISLSKRLLPHLYRASVSKELHVTIKRQNPQKSGASAAS